MSLPSAYRQVEYIESSGTQKINTGLRLEHDVNDEFYVGVHWTSSFPFTQEQWVSGTEKYFYGVDKNGKYNFDRWTASADVIATSGFDDVYIKIDKTNSSTTSRMALLMSVNNTTIHNSPSSGMGELNYDIYLFACNSSSTKTWCRISYYKHYKNNVLVRDLVPCYRKSDNKPGMYDLVSNTFFTNNGTGEFEIGEKVPEFQPMMFSRAVIEPYEELEYIQSNGTQHIDTGIEIGSGNKRFVFAFDMTKVMVPTGEGGDSNYAYQVPIGSYESGGTQYYFREYNETSGMSWQAANKTTYRANYSISALTRYDVDCELLSSLTKCSVNGVEVLNKQEENVFSSTSHIALFGAKRGTSVYRPLYGKIYFAKIYDSTTNTLLRDFIPVRRKSDGAIGMLDRVSNTFYGNQGTGTFIAGPIIQEVEYIESSETQRIDTGIKGTDGTKVTVDFQFTKSGARQLMGYGTDWYQYFGASAADKIQLDALDTTYSSLDRHRISFETLANYVRKLYVDDVLAKNETGPGSSSDTSNANFLLFHTSHALWGCQGKLFGFVAERNGSIIREMVPVKINDEYCLLDKVEHKVYRNAGTGSFTGGPVVEKNYFQYCFLARKNAKILAGYTELQYIHGSGKARFDTGLKYHTTMTIEGEYERKGSIGYSTALAICSHLYLGAQDGGSHGDRIKMQGRTFQYVYVQSWTELPMHVAFRIDHAKDELVVNGEVVASNFFRDYVEFGTGEYTSEDNIFVGSDGQYDINTDIYKLKIWDDETNLVLDLVPAKRDSDAAVGMYDKVTGTFFENEGTGSFTAGPAVMPLDYIIFGRCDK